uniref:Uncharacterized protein n=1 Tax=Panagrolaimus sp. JU765 TaxID=591449 RepID=A0AC34RL40_9BILA
MLRRKTVVPGPGNCQPQSSKYEMEWSPLNAEYCKQYQNHHQPSHHLIRIKPNSKERRSRSQPQHRVENIPDIERYSMDSETSGSNDSGIRSSTHSATSSNETNSIIGNHHGQDEVRKCCRASSGQFLKL